MYSRRCSRTQDWKETTLGPTKNLEAGIEAFQMRKLKADLEAALSKVECLEYELHKARQEPGQQSEDEKQLTNKDIMGRLRDLKAGMENLR